MHVTNSLFLMPVLIFALDSWVPSHSVRVGAPHHEHRLDCVRGTKGKGSRRASLVEREKGGRNPQPLRVGTKRAVHIPREPAARRNIFPNTVALSPTLGYRPAGSRSLPCCPPEEKCSWCDAQHEKRRENQ